MMFITQLGMMRVEQTDSFWVGLDMKAVAPMPDRVIEVQADGDELAHIINTMVNIPYSKKLTVQTWFGDHARFIVANW